MRTARRGSTRRRLGLAGAAAGLATMAVTAAAVGTSASAAGLDPVAYVTGTPYCGITWGSLAKTAEHPTTAQVTGVRSGQHRCFDRLVIDLNGPRSGYSVQYVDQVVEDGSGRAIAVNGGARLQVSVNAPDYDLNGHRVYRPNDAAHVVDVAGYRTFRQVVYAGSFEGYTSFGLGVRARLPFRVFTLTGPGNGSRVVIDVAHRW